MKIRSFSSTINFAKANLIEDKADDNVNLIKNFDSIMRQASAYIRKIVEENFDGENISASELNELILADYNRIVADTYQITDIPIISMKYIAIKYLSAHRNQVPELLREIDERGMTYSENETYTDDFHENLLIALLAIRDDYREYCENMKATNPEFLAEIEALVEENGKVGGFKKYCDKYAKMTGLNYSARRQIISYGYLSIFGLEGLDESSVPEKSAVLKYKASNFVKDYIPGYLERLEPLYRENLENSIISRFCQLDQFGEIADNVVNHNERMRRIGLPGLGYSCDQELTLAGGVSLPKLQTLINKESLSNLDIDVLLRMNSFYNNRLAKVISDYSMAIFVMDNLGSTKAAFEGTPPTKAEVGEETIEGLVLKYQTLILPIKSFYTETQRQIEEHPDDFDGNVQEINSDNSELGNKKQVVLDLDDFIKDVRKSWRKEYTDYFDQRLPGVNNDLKQDIFLANVLYNPVFLSYRFKNMALKSEYAYLYYLSQTQQNKSLNFGVVLKSDKDYAKRTVLLASDGGVNLPNRLHTIKRDFTDFLVSYTGEPLARIYEGFKDFVVGGEYVSSKILLPNSKQHSKYLKDLKRGKLAEKGDKTSRISPLNEKFVEHFGYCADSYKFMKSHTVPGNRLDKKGNVIQEQVQPIRYVDLNTGIIYTQRENGKLVSKDGRVYGETERETEEREI